MSETNEKTRLIELYATMSDGELEKIFEDFSELTAIAQEALQGEIDKRGLNLRVPGEVTTVQVPSQENQAPDNIVVPRMGDLAVVRRFRDLPEAMLAKGSLDSAGVESYFADDNMVRMDWFLSNLIGGVKLVVRPEDLDVANEILNQPIPEGIDYGDNEPFEQPTCPRCGALEISFEELNKPIAYTSAWLNVPIPIKSPKWKCDSCGAVWVEDEDSEIEEEGAQT